MNATFGANQSMGQIDQTHNSERKWKKTRKKKTMKIKGKEKRLYSACRGLEPTSTKSKVAHMLFGPSVQPFVYLVKEKT